MFLEYGVNEHGELIRIDQVARGRLAGVYCPYCGRPLLVRKGELKAPHFAHDGETCRAVARDADVIALPAYDHFNLNLSARDYKLYQSATEFILHQTGGGVKRGDFEYLETLGLVRFNSLAAGRHGAWELTHLGRIPVGQLSLMLFNDVQEPMIIEKYTELERAAYNAVGSPDFEVALTDLRLYTAQVRRILSTTLYFLEIEHADGVLHKIGVTTRTADDRAAEIVSDLRPHVGHVRVKVIDTWSQRGNVELYFKHRYQKYNAPIGDLTEYFQFTPDEFKAALRDLRHMKLKTLTEGEQAILVGLPNRIERGIPPEDRVMELGLWLVLDRLNTADQPLQFEAGDQDTIRFLRANSPSMITQHFNDNAPITWELTERGQAYYDYFVGFYRTQYAAYFDEREETARAERRRAAIREGMKQAAASGQHVGRPADDDLSFLEKPQAKAIRAALERGLSLRETKRETGAAVNTIRKVKALLDRQQNTR